jgi:hypothetical protein
MFMNPAKVFSASPVASHADAKGQHSDIYRRNSSSFGSLFGKKNFGFCQ